MNSNWPNAIAHVDADCFFASCELMRHPELSGSPVCVLSSQDACVVAKTYDAKAVGIKTGMPVWEAKKVLPNATYLSADFYFYGLISEKMFSILRRYSPDIEVYSIDEGFMDLNGLRLLWRKGFEELAHDIRRTIHQEVGITVSIGVSVTRTLAKMASEYNKPNGVTMVPGKMTEQFLERVSLSDIPGIGRNREALLAKFRIYSPVAFVKTNQHMIQRLLGKAGTDLWHELQGVPTIPLELYAKLPKSIARTASLGQVTSEKRIIYSHLVHHSVRLTTELVTKRLLVKQLKVFLRLKSFNSVSSKIELNFPTNNYFNLSRYIHNAMDELYHSDEKYRACGVIAGKISREEESQPDLFGHMKRDAKQASLFLIVDDINKRYGMGTVGMAAAKKISNKRKFPRFIYPLIQAS